MRKPMLAVGAAALLVPMTPGLASSATSRLTAADTGVFGELFVEPTGEDCVSAIDPGARCKATANAIAQLADGRQVYWSGLEGMDDLKGNTVVTGYGSSALNSEARLLDLRGKKPRFAAMQNPDSGINPTGNDSENEYLPGGFYNNDVKSNDGDLFCADLNFLADGRIITNGGTAYYQEPGLPGDPKFGIVELNGLKNTRIFNPRTNTWSEAGKMNWARWYPTMVTQADGSILAFSGVTKLIKPFYPERPGDSLANERHVERFDPKTGKWTDLPGSAKKSMPLFPRLHLLPDGRTLFNAAGQVFNPAGYAYDEATWNFTSAFDPKTNTWTDLGINDFGGLPLGFRGSGSSVMLMLKPGDLAARFLGVGGVAGTTPGTYFGTAATTLTEIDTRTNGFHSSPAGSLHSPRWLTDAVMLPTGQVWAVNGGDRDHLLAPGIDLANTTTEMFDPATGQWTVTAAQSRKRSYHTTAILLPDARVLVGGHAPIGTLYGEPTDMFRDSIGAAPGYADPTFQIFSPPNLFWGKRPVITKVNPNVTTGQVLTVNVDNPKAVSSVRMLRNASLTHLVDGDQRNVELEIIGRTDKAVLARVPSGNYLPAGPYMLFAHSMSDRGEVPSVSRQVFVDAKLPTGQVRELTTRAAALARAELKAPVAAVPAAGDLGSAGLLPAATRPSDVPPLVATTTSVARTASRRTARRTRLTLVRRAG